MNPGEGEMGLFDHLAELRKRLLWSAVAIVLGAIAAFIYSEPLFHLLTSPFFASFKGGQLIGIGPAEAFMTRIKVALLGGSLLVSPVVFHQLWLFVAPGLYDHERKMVVPFVTVTTLLFLSGVALCFYGIFPVAFEFFSDQYRVIGVMPTVRMSEYLSMVIFTLLGFGMVFEMPVLAFFLAKLGLLTYEMMTKYLRYAIVLVFIISAVVTPPDVLSQILLAVPLMILYGISMLVVKHTERRAAENLPAEQL